MLRRNVSRFCVTSVNKLKQEFIMQPTFAEVLETVEKFTIDEKETLVDILQNRLREIKRQQNIKSVEESQREFEQGLCKPISADEFMKEVLS